MTEELTDEEQTPLNSLEVLNAELFSFRISPPEYKAQRAFTLIKKYFELGQVIPTELGSFLTDACDYQLDNLGNRVTNGITDNNWRSRVIDVEMLRRCGYTVDKAIEAIVERDNRAYTDTESSAYTKRSAYTESSLKAKRREYKVEREPEYIDKTIYETIKIYGLVESDLAKIVLDIS